jgi:hypothetical protein
MEVIIDGERNFRFQGEPADVMAALRAINDFLHAGGRAMLSLKVDGREVRPDGMVDDLSSIPVDEVSTLEIASESTAVLADECLQELRQSAGELSSLCHDLAAVFHSESPEDGFAPFHQLADIWATIKTRQVMVVNALGLNLEAILIEGASLAQIHAELNEYLKEAVQALENGDCILLGDLLEYELAPRAEQEPGIVACLEGYIPAKPR